MMDGKSSKIFTVLLQNEFSSPHLFITHIISTDPGAVRWMGFRKILNVHKYNTMFDPLCPLKATQQLFGNVEYFCFYSIVIYLLQHHYIQIR